LFQAATLLEIQTRNILIDVLELSPLPKQTVPLILCQSTFDCVSNNTR